MVTGCELSYDGNYWFTTISLNGLSLYIRELWISAGLNGDCFLLQCDMEQVSQNVLTPELNTNVVFHQPHQQHPVMPTTVLPPYTQNPPTGEFSRHPHRLAMGRPAGISGGKCDILECENKAYDLFVHSGYQVNSYYPAPGAMGQFGFVPWFAQHRTAKLPVVGEEDTMQGVSSMVDDSGKQPVRTLSPGEVGYRNLSPETVDPVASHSQGSSERLCNGDSKESLHDHSHHVDVKISPVTSCYEEGEIRMGMEPYSWGDNVIPTSQNGFSPISMITKVSSLSAGQIHHSEGMFLTSLSFIRYLTRNCPFKLVGTNGLNPKISQSIQSSVRFNVSITMPTTKHIHDVVVEIQKAIDASSCVLTCRKESGLKFALSKSTVQMEMEVC